MSLWVVGLLGLGGGVVSFRWVRDTLGDVDRYVRATGNLPTSLAVQRASAMSIRLAVRRHGLWGLARLGSLDRRLGSLAATAMSLPCFEPVWRTTNRLIHHQRSRLTRRWRPTVAMLVMAGAGEMLAAWRRLFVISDPSG